MRSVWLCIRVCLKRSFSSLFRRRCVTYTPSSSRLENTLFKQTLNEYSLSIKLTSVLALTLSLLSAVSVRAEEVLFAKTENIHDFDRKLSRRLSKLDARTGTDVNELKKKVAARKHQRRAFEARPVSSASSVIFRPKAPREDSATSRFGAPRGPGPAREQGRRKFIKKKKPPKQTP